MAHAILAIDTEVKARLVAVAQLGANRVFETEKDIKTPADLPAAWYEFEGGDIEYSSSDSANKEDLNADYDEQFEVTIVAATKATAYAIMESVLDSIQLPAAGIWMHVQCEGWAKQPKEEEGVKMMSIGLTFSLKYTTTRLASGTQIS